MYKVSEVKQVVNTEVLNNLLKEKWVLLKICSTRNKVLYIVALPKSKAACNCDANGKYSLN